MDKAAEIQIKIGSRLQILTLKSKAVHNLLKGAWEANLTMTERGSMLEGSDRWFVVS